MGLRDDKYDMEVLLNRTIHFSKPMGKTNIEPNVLLP